MTKVTFDISVSLDGFIAGPGDGVDLGLGEGGERLHEWLFDLESWRERHGLEGGERSRDAEVLEEAFATTGAVLMGRRMFDIAEGAWGDDPPFHMPVFIVTHNPRETIEKQGGTTYTFVTGGIDAALEQARAAASDRDISIAGGADVICQYLRAGAVDEFQVHIAPLLLGAGRRLFGDAAGEQPELERTRVVESPTGVTHIKYRVVR
jgi:dihydrofolate reductase